jgi:RNA processing factor Prp31
MEKLSVRARRTGNISAGLIDQHIDQTCSKIRKIDRKIQNRNAKLKEIYSWNKEMNVKQTIQGWKYDGLERLVLEHGKCIGEVAEATAKLSEIADKRVDNLIVSFTSILGKEISIRETEIKRLDKRVADLYRKTLNTPDDIVLK